MSLIAHGLVHGHTPLSFRLLGLAHALAEHHNAETGDCFPKLATLAQRGETNERTVRRMLAELEQARVIRRIPSRDASGRQVSNGYEFLPAVSILSGGGDTSVRGEEDTSVLPINRKNESLSPLRGDCAIDAVAVTPTATAQDSPRRLNGCPYEAIRGLWAEILPSLSQPLPTANWTANRKAQIRARWQDQLPDLHSWRETFEQIKASPFLMGQQHSPNRKPFQCTLWWITKPENLSRLYEGNYDA